MLEHTNTHKFIIALHFGDIPIITYLYAAALRQSSLTNMLLCQLSLWLAEGDAVRFYSIVLCSIDDQSAPATTDIQQALSRTQAQLATNVVQLTLLCRVQGIVGRGKVRTGVDHASIQPQCIKIIRTVIVIGDGLPITLFGVACPVQFCCRIMRGWLAELRQA